ncbi:MAG: hypothetical protein AAF937_03635 [Planctomycetota bacterium]
MRRAPFATACAAVSLVLVGCAGRQVEGWYDASRGADLRNYEGIVAASSYEPKDEALAAMRGLGAIARARYQLDHLSANERGFKRATDDWERMTIDMLEAYGIVTRLSALPIERLARGERDSEIADGLAEVRRIIGRWGGAPVPTQGTRRIRP